jgi:hypothetical protein
MFTEINPKYIKKDDSHHKKRWFRDAQSGCDLFVWLDEKAQVVKFQFWREDALIEWTAESGLKTGKIDPATGGFKHYHASFYRYHFDFDTKIVHNVRNLIGGLLGNDESKEIFNLVVDELKGIG